MDNSKEFQSMLNKAIESEPLAFKNFDRTKNVQDQLQEILKAKYLTPLIGALYKWLKDNDYDQYYFGNVTSNPYFSMEQIWLAFVMSELYHKIWQNGEWLEIPSQTKI